MTVFATRPARVLLKAVVGFEKIPMECLTLIL